MKLVVLSREGTDYSRPTYEFIEMLRRRYPMFMIDEIDLNTREGAAIASLYDIYEFPAFIVTTNDGLMVNMWAGLPAPLIDEVAGQLLS
jgi:hypothetical protein